MTQGHKVNEKPEDPRTEILWSCSPNRSCWSALPQVHESASWSRFTVAFVLTFVRLVLAGGVSGHRKAWDNYSLVLGRVTRSSTGVNQFGRHKNHWGSWQASDQTTELLVPWCRPFFRKKKNKLRRNWSLKFRKLKFRLRLRVFFFFSQKWLY